ncbi:MAG: 50S ribosomal protein L6 [Patescibacteria group bacterium]|jgi:large subunit ribosomal protein L6
MSRKANKPISIPTGVTVTVVDHLVTVKGPKGELQQKIHPLVTVTVETDGVHVSVQQPDEKFQRSLWGTTGALISNMIVGVVTHYAKQLEINGVGYGFEVKGKQLQIKAGYSHVVLMDIPEGVAIKQERNLITLSSHDKQLLGQFAAEVRKVRKPEPYKGKGIKYADEVIIRKQGKQAASA